MPPATSPVPVTGRLSFGERVAAVDGLLGGTLTREGVQSRFGLSDAELDRWLAAHARDRAITLDEFRQGGDPALRAMRLRLKRLQGMLKHACSELSLLRSLARERGYL